MALHFKVVDLLREIAALRGIASSYLPSSGASILQQVEDDLKNLAKRSSGSTLWTIDPSYPLTTRVSEGHFQRKGRGKMHVFATVSFVWDLEPVRTPKDKMKDPAKVVALAGKASTVIRIMESETEEHPEREIAMWRMEVADDASPGTYFHVQVLGTEIDAPFPKALDVPRLPSVLVSPFACVEFVISELFQDEWSRTSGEESGSMNMWRSIQAKRSLRQLKWHADIIENDAGSPWNALKTERPPVDLFL